MDAITWRNETRRLDDLRPRKDNPRQIKRKQAEKLLESWDKFDQVHQITINPSGIILDGHQRYHVLLAAYEDPGMEVDVRVASRELTRKEWQELVVVLHESSVGEWDWDALANWDGIDLEDLSGWGFEGWKLKGFADEISPEIDYGELWRGMPEFEQQSGGAVRTLNIYFADEEHVAAFAELIGQNITDKTKGIWYPKRERVDADEHVCKDES